jgi:hypothetical protein
MSGIANREVSEPPNVQESVKELADIVIKYSKSNGFSRIMRDFIEINIILNSEVRNIVRPRVEEWEQDCFLQSAGQPFRGYFAKELEKCVQGNEITTASLPDIHQPGVTPHELSNFGPPIGTNEICDRVSHIVEFDGEMTIIDEWRSRSVGQGDTDEGEEGELYESNSRGQSDGTGPVLNNRADTVKEAKNRLREEHSGSDGIEEGVIDTEEFLFEGNNSISSQIPQDGCENNVPEGTIHTTPYLDSMDSAWMDDFGEPLAEDETRSSNIASYISHIQTEDSMGRACSQVLVDEEQDIMDQTFAEDTFAPLEESSYIPTPTRGISLRSRPANRYARPPSNSPRQSYSRDRQQDSQSPASSSSTTPARRPLPLEDQDCQLRRSKVGD